MKTNLKALACLCFIFSLAAVSSAKEWRGLKPLHSTREDVERLLGAPPPPPKDGSRGYESNKSRSIYFLDEGEVYIAFVEPTDSVAAYCVGKVPNGTVLMIQVKPKNDWTFGALQLDERQFRKFDPTQPADPDYEGYIDEKDGLAVVTFKGKVQQIKYFAAAEDKHVCPGYYETIEASMQTFVCGLRFMRKFDEYGDISFSDEKARLDNIAIQLRNEPETLLYIIGYAGRKARIGEAQTKADRAKNYLNFERRLEPGRMIAIDGGYREELTLEFFIVSAGASPPTASPTVDPSEVTFISYDEKKPARRSKP
jgi:hypothetical protein